MNLDLVAAFAAGYFLGGLPAALWIARLAGENIFKVGSGNMGSMNTARNIGPVAGIAVFVADSAKGAAAVTLGLWMGGVAGVADPLVLGLIGGVGAVVGHAWSPYVKFQGGKGMAAAFGATLPIVPLGGIASIFVVIALILITRRSELSAILALLAFPFVNSTILLRMGASQEDAFLVGTGMALVALVSIVKHVFVWRQRGRSAAASDAATAADARDADASDAGERRKEA